MSGPQGLPGATEGTAGDGGSSSLLYGILHEIISSPIYLALAGVTSFLVYKITRSRQQPRAAVPVSPEMPRMRRDFMVAELKQFDGTQADGRILVAVNGNVYDVTKGKNFYGPGGPYAAFGGRDASRGLATFSVTASSSDEYDDLSDLKSDDMETVREWEMQFKEKYIHVGRLLKPGEPPTNYSYEEEDGSVDESPSAVRKRVAVAAIAAEKAAAQRESPAKADAATDEPKVQEPDAAGEPNVEEKDKAE